VGDIGRSASEIVKMNRPAWLSLVMVVAVLGLSACASNQEGGPHADGDPRSARVLLEQVNRSGPMPVVVRGPIPGSLTAPALAEALGTDISGTPASFVAPPEAPTDAARVILLFGPPDQLSPWRACDPSTALGSGFGENRRVAALVCDGPSTVAHLRGAAASDSGDDVIELMHRVGRSLFPDPYADRYNYNPYGGYAGYGGFGSFGNDVGVGVGFGLGF
jgi:hypothetical protein